MLSLVRSGPTILKISVSGDIVELMGFMAKMYSSPGGNFDDSFDMAGEGDTLLFIGNGSEDEFLHYQTNITPSAVLCDLINRKMCGAIQHISITAPNIVMRLVGNLDAAIDQIAVDFKAHETTNSFLLKNMDESSVLVNFTSEPINRAVQLC